MEYTEQLLEVYHKLWIFFGTVAVVLLAASVVMFIGFRIPKIVRKWRWIRVLVFVLALGGAAGACDMKLRAEAGVMQATEEKEKVEGAQETEKAEEVEGSEEMEGPEESEETKAPEEPEEPEEPVEPEKPEEPTDIMPPEFSVIWRDEQGRVLELEAYYQTGKELFLELTILEEHLDMEETRIYLEARNASRKLSDIPEIRELHGKTWASLRKEAGLDETEEDTEKDETESEETEQEETGNEKCFQLKEEPGSYHLTIHLKTEAIYQISARIQDEAGNTPVESSEGYVSLGSFCLDRTKPVISEEQGITLEAEHQTLLEKLIHQVTFGYFCQPDLTVRIQAEDAISGIGEITYICEGTGGEEEPGPVTISGTVRPGDGLVYEENGARAYGVFSLPYSFQGIIQAQARDRAGIFMEGWRKKTGILIESEEMHKKTSSARVTVEGAPAGRDHFYREDVSLRYVMEDHFSGIRSVWLQAGSQREELFFEEEGQEIRREADLILTIPAGENNQNEISISGGFTDFAGHTTEVIEPPVIHIDTSPPKIEVEWLNQDVRNEKYYQADQTARITIWERNFLPDQVQLALTGMEDSVLSWIHQPGEGCGGSSDPGDWGHSDDCAWMADLVFDKDGGYSFGISCQDAAGNRGSYEKTETFVIDKTPPVLLVHWDDAEPLNGHYYARERSAVVEIRERNLYPGDLEALIEAHEKGEEIAAPKLGPLRQWEEDSFRCGITFSEDGRYSLRLRCTDLAGNEAEAYDSEEFVIDRTPPELTFENVADCSANRGMVAPRLRVLDTNFDPEQTQVSLQGSNGTGQLPVWTKSSEEQGFTMLWGDFEQVPENDDLYRIKARAGDLAGNVSEAELTFSVNRFGSVYELEEATALLAGPGGSRYASQEPDLVITEYNPDFLNYYQVTSSREGETVELKEGRDYQVERTGTRDTWKTYRYRIDKENFEKEGIYLVTLYSEDQARNASNNRMKEKSLEFIVDKTGPSVVVTGVKDWERVKGKSLELLADVRDAYALAGAEVYVNGQCTATYDRDMLREMDGMLVCPVSGAKVWQTFSIRAWDEAGNETETEPVHFLVTEQIRFRFPGDDEPKVVWAVCLGGILLLAGGCLVLAERIRRRLKSKAL